MSKHRDGGKIRGTHTTVTELAGEVTDIFAKLADVRGISPGWIQSGKGVAGGARNVKISEYEGGLLLTVRQSRSIQELRVLVNEMQPAKEAVARALRDNDIPITFRK